MEQILARPNFRGAVIHKNWSSLADEENQQKWNQKLLQRAQVLDFLLILGEFPAVTGGRPNKEQDEQNQEIGGNVKNIK